MPEKPNNQTNRQFYRRQGKRILISCLFFIALMFVANALPLLDDFISLPTTGSCDNWGLSFPEAGQTPVGNADTAYLAKFNSYFVGDTEQPVIYLTFDAGFENGCTAKILDALQKHNAPATFFLVGSYIRNNGELVQRMVHEGHIVGNHTDTHPDMSAISDTAAFKQEITAVEQAYKNLLGQDMPKFYRPPQGKYSEHNLQMAKDLGYTTVFWSLAYVDWQENDQPSREQAFSKLLPRIHNGAIVLLHSTSATNAEIMDELLTKWEEMGYTFKSLTDLPPIKQ